MKKNLLYPLLLPLAFIVSCSSDDEPKVNLLIGEWELEKIVISDPPPGYSTKLILLEPKSTLLGETDYEIEFNEDLTYVRTIQDAFLRVEDQIVRGDLMDEGEWEETGDDLDMDIDEVLYANSEINFRGIPTRFTILRKTADTLVLETTDTWTAWSPGLVNAGGLDTVTTQSGIETLIEDGYRELVDMTFTMTFEKD